MNKSGSGNLKSLSNLGLLPQKQSADYSGTSCLHFLAYVIVELDPVNICLLIVDGMSVLSIAGAGGTAGGRAFLHG